MTCATTLSLMAVKLSISLATILSMAEVASSAAGSPSGRCACCEWASPAISPDLRRFAVGAASSAVHTGGRSGRGLPRGWLRAGRGARSLPKECFGPTAARSLRWLVPGAARSTEKLAEKRPGSRGGLRAGLKLWRRGVRVSLSSVFAPPVNAKP